ncbi:aminotransferase class III-fold pyridoxal phosphate-dependent enzyme [Actinoplanes derwentensis]|uniref:Adenosylmethionine-8-amino-7-oxononanoate aminotransferase n=1 Tax=Actinoplanes derwentensis TaxID=113562 RepID=A0A1H2DCZ2_9ACTN|nr:aminotransferase class III-fold pyridoxal phosphate-dependent enzyme [Actinoplanes derwentensis]GID89978.1 hypothetical protein Ade03nite_89020 [Actinoplanes derwentensis]SDT80600.1 Adenosylmethionine-8-amino-7-oxononanoate aminotransferase [Actinoplanes derwentensis]
MSAVSTAVLVNRRPILLELAGWIRESGAAVTLLTSHHSIGADGGMAALRAAGVAVTVLDDYDAPAVTGLIRDACVRSRAERLLSTTEVDVIRCAEVRADLGLPGQSVASAVAYRNKLVMKSHCAEAGLGTAAMAMATDAPGLARLTGRGGRFVVKPVAGVASKDTHVAESPADLHHLLSTLDDVDRFLVEEFVVGDMFHVDGLMLDGAMVQAWPSRYLYQQWETMYQARPNLSAMLPPADPLTTRLLATTARVVAALPPAEGMHAFHAEYFVRPDGQPVLCEIASRAGGAGIAEAYERSFGVSLYGEPIRQQLGLAPHAECFAAAPRQRHGWGWFPPHRGTLVALPESCTVPGTVRYSGAGAVGRSFDGPHAVTDAVVDISFEIDGSTRVMDRLLAYDAWWRTAAVWANEDRKEPMTALWHPWNPATAQEGKTVYDYGTGYHLTDAAGHTYIDAMSGALNANCGHGEPRLVAAATAQLSRLCHVDLGVAAHEPARRLAVALADLLPAGRSWHTVFVNSGSEATELAVKMAHDYWRNIGQPRSALVSFADGYHGSTLLAKSLTGLPGNTADLPIAVPVTRIALPTDARELRDASADELLRLFSDALLAEPVAAVIVEALLNVGGGVILPRGFLTGLRRLCDETGTLLILDEVFCGLGRTGRIFGFEHEGITPDIVTTSKGLGAGFVPIAATSADDRIFRSYDSATPPDVLRYGHTTGGHAVACAVALEVLAILKTDRLAENAAARGGELLVLLESLADLPGVHDVRGLGLVVTVEFTSETLAERAEKLAREAGVILRRQRQHLMAIPPLIIDESGVKTLAGLVAAAVDAAVCEDPDG